VVETLDVRHPGHTSDSEQDFNSRAYSFRVKPAPALFRVVPTGPGQMAGIAGLGSDRNRTDRV
jgi:hypothetical protein